MADNDPEFVPRLTEVGADKAPAGKVIETPLSSEFGGPVMVPPYKTLEK